MVRRLASVVLIALGILFWAVAAVSADVPLRSTNYEFDESVLGTGGLTQESSANYQLGESIGDLAVGNSSSTGYQVNASYTTTSDPALTFAVNTPTASFGNFSPGATATATATFQVIDYTSYGYEVLVAGNPPSNGSHTITAMASTGVSQIGVEQFGINLVANTAPISFGANPNNGSFGFGAAATNYNTPNQYRYVSGEAIAEAPKSSGLTTYTISYIVNVTNLTLGGQYTANQTLICIGTY